MHKVAYVLLPQCEGLGLLAITADQFWVFNVFVFTNFHCYICTRVAVVWNWTAGTGIFSLNNFKTKLFKISKNIMKKKSDQKLNNSDDGEPLIYHGRTFTVG